MSNAFDARFRPKRTRPRNPVCGDDIEMPDGRRLQKLRSPRLKMNALSWNRPPTRFGSTTQADRSGVVLGGVSIPCRTPGGRSGHRAAHAAGDTEMMPEQAAEQLDPESLVAGIMAELKANPAAQQMLLRAMLTREVLGMPVRLNAIERDVAEIPSPHRELADASGVEVFILDPNH